MATPQPKDIGHEPAHPLTAWLLKQDPSLWMGPGLHHYRARRPEEACMCVCACMRVHVHVCAQLHWGLPIQIPCIQSMLHYVTFYHRLMPNSFMHVTTLSLHMLKHLAPMAKACTLEIHICNNVHSHGQPGALWGSRERSEAPSLVPRPISARSAIMRGRLLEP